MNKSDLTTSAILSTDNVSSTHKENENVEYASLYLQYDLTYFLWLIVPPALLLLGCCGNSLIIVVMYRLRASEPTASLSVFFTALAFSDLFLLLTSVLWDWPDVAFNGPIPYLNKLPCTIPFFVLYSSSMTSAWFLVAMTCQRLTSVLVPHRVGLLCTVRRGKLITAFITIVVCSVNVYIFFIYRQENVDDKYVECVSVNEDIANAFRLLDLFLASLIPFLVLIIANCILIYRAQQSLSMSRSMIWTEGDGGGSASGHQVKSRTAKFSSMTRTLILTSLAFLILTLPTCILDMYLEAEGYYKDEIEDDDVNKKLAVGESVCVLLWIGNSSVNFYIYILSGRKFRLETQRCLGLCLKRTLNVQGKVSVRT